MADYYSTKEAAELTGASRQSIRIYTGTYQRHFSTEGAPAQAGQPRRFTAADLNLIRFIYTSTAEQKLTHEQVKDRLATGALEQFAWHPPEATESAEQSEVPHSTALVPVERLQAAQALMLDAQRREREVAEHAQALQDRLIALERELGKAQGELSAYKTMLRKPPAWWARLFGGRQSE